MNLYIIAHKVRGELSLDVAAQLEMPDGPWWIIPTSGHRAYPFWWHPLDRLLEVEPIPEMPADLRDHYETDQATLPRSPKPRLDQL